ncbi:MAG TPA: 30S ribosome-binding factor RbfA [Chloroflexi bacterium]|jgi:ribosome-binding factor A|nr:30S ribosome-binding factor RbfA [Chloroflexota bacterium]
MKKPYRRERAGVFIQQELTLLLRNAVRDPRVADVIITDVELTADRRIARVYVSCYEGEEALHEGLAGLESAKPFLRQRLGQSLHWRFTPELEFRVDNSWQHGERIEAILRDITESEQTDDERGEGADSDAS